MQQGVFLDRRLLDFEKYKEISVLRFFFSIFAYSEKLLNEIFETYFWNIHFDVIQFFLNLLGTWQFFEKKKNGKYRY